MTRFIRLWATFWIGYAIVGYFVVGGLYLSTLIGWSDGPSSGLLRARIPRAAQQLYAFGIFNHPTLGAVLSIHVEPPPSIAQDAPPSERDAYKIAIERYYGDVRRSASRRRVIYFTWVSLVSAALALAYVAIRKRKNVEPQRPAEPSSAGAPEGR